MRINEIDRMYSPKTRFETEPCNVCSGNDTQCPKCHGNKVTLSKRGKAAQRYYFAGFKRLARDLKVDDIIWIKLAGGFAWYFVTEIVPSSNSTGNSEQPTSLDLTLEYRGRLYNHTVAPNTMMIAADGQAELYRRLADALVYQGILSKSGKPLIPPDRLKINLDS
jgi:hypothetical protein